MAASNLTALQVFSQTLQTVATEVQSQKADLFNAATRGAIQLMSAPKPGDVSDVTKYQLLSGLIQERDAYTDQDVVAQKFARILEGSVKLARRIGPAELSPSELAWIGRAPGELAVVLGQQAAPAMLADKLNTAIAAAVAAIENVGASLVHDYSGTGKLSLSVLNTGASLFGDRAGNIACWIMHSKTWFDLVASALTNTEKLFSFGTINVMSDGLGRPIIITDSADLKDGAKYYTLGLQPGAVVVEDNGAVRAVTQELTLHENLKTIYQGEYEYSLGMLGYQWALGTGGKCPNLAAVTSGANWTKTATSIKDTAGLVVISQ